MCKIILFNINMYKNDNPKESPYASVIHLYIFGNSYILCKCIKIKYLSDICLCLFSNKADNTIFLTYVFIFTNEKKQMEKEMQR